MNSRQQGAIGVAKAIAHYSSLGWSVSVPIADAQRYDLIVDDGSGPQRVECKTSTTGDFHLRTQGGNRSWSGEPRMFDPTEVERLFLYNVTTGQSWDYPAEDVTQKTYIRPPESR